jgi:hypothetical protein
MKKILIEDIKRIKELMFQDDEIEIDEDSFDDETYEEMTEEGEETNTTSSGAGASQGYPTVGVWDSGKTRGPANPITSAKREDKVVRGPANKLV